MNVFELSKEQFAELKQSYYDELKDCGQLEEICDKQCPTIDDIPDDVIYEHYKLIFFTKEDFTCE